MYNATQIAEYIISECTDDGYPVSNLQLQKILYYVQKKFLEHDLKAFDDKIEAWQIGPVVPAVYNRYCGFGSFPIEMHYAEQLSEEYRVVINNIVKQKRTLRPWDMVNDVHAEGKAWSLIYNNGKGDKMIIPEKIIAING